jgi:hypothetical protein
MDRLREIETYQSRELLRLEQQRLESQRKVEEERMKTLLMRVEAISNLKVPDYHPYYPSKPK